MAASTLRQHTSDGGAGGSIGAQLVNSIPPIYARRFANGTGAEAASLASIVIRAWTPVRTAAFALVEQVLRAQLDPGAEADVTRVLEGVARSAFLTREAVRDGVVRPLIEPALRDIESARARGIARLRPENAQAFVDDICRKVCERVDLLAAQIAAGIDPLFGPERLLAAIDRAVASSHEPLAAIIAALERIRSRALEEAERIDRDLRDCTASLEQERETLRIVAVEANRSFFGKERHLGKLIAVVATTVPRLGNARVTALYLPLVRRGIPALLGALEDRVERLHDRRLLLARALDRLGAAARDADVTDAASGRVLVVGAPATAAATAAEVERVTGAARGSAARALRDLAVHEAPSATVLEALLDRATEAVSRHAVPRSLDDVLLTDTDPAQTALALDHLIQAASMPVALTSNADRHFLAGTRCSVMRAARGSRIPALLAEHAGYRPDAFCTDGAADRLEVLALQPGIDLEETAVFRAGIDAYESEVADRASPPVHVLSDDCLAGLSRRPNGKPEPAEQAAERVK